MTSPAPLGVYVHWPYCARICPYCDFNVFRARGRDVEAEAAAGAIIADLEAQRALSGPRQLVSIFFGGGTPSLMDPAWVGRIGEAAARLWTPAADLEVSLEANPTDAETARFEALAAAGVNRLSLGLQALDDAALAFLGRDHGAEEGRRAAEAALRVFGRVSLDLIYARPEQTVADWTAELEAAIALGAEHISPYQLTIEAGTAFERAVRRKAWTPPDDALAADLYDATQDVLSAAGFEAYEVSNHARGSAAQSRHNLVYWRGWDYVGVGPGAHGRLTLEDGRIATQAPGRPADYVAAVAAGGVSFGEPERLDAVAVAEERLLSGLRIADGVAFAELGALGLTPDHKAVRRLRDLGMVADDPLHLRVTTDGRRLLNAVIADLVT